MTCRQLVAWGWMAALLCLVGAILCYTERETHVIFQVFTYVMVFLTGCVIGSNLMFWRWVAVLGYWERNL